MTKTQLLYYGYGITGKSDLKRQDGYWYFRTVPNILKKNLAADNIQLEDSSCIVFITSVFLRTMLKYGERGYRFILQEIGFVGQNISLVSEALGLSSCMLGGFLDDEINSFLEIDGPSETIQNIIVIGHK
ncbi:MAG: nitroreductase family protein [Tannerellaceae bacterium]|jgi:SagB-type dehydrogenase family enzyme|nr:nitroreductase family protein [Tannerellaceae bacterium]